MLAFHSEQYATVREAKLGRAQLSDLLESLRQWIAETYSINVLHIDYVGLRTWSRLHVIVHTADDAAPLCKDARTIRRKVQQRILRRFARMVADTNTHGTYETTDTQLFVEAFSQASIQRAAAQFRENHAEQVETEFADSGLYEIALSLTATFVLYSTDEQLHTNATNGTSDAIADRCFELVKRYDEFDYIRRENFPFNFDSKENLDANHGGSLPNLFR